jgi:hypothetical protein
VPLTKLPNPAPAVAIDPPLPADAPLHPVTRDLLAAIALLERTSQETLARTDALLQGFARAVDRFARQTRHETLSALLLVSLAAAAGAVLATLLTLAATAPGIGLLGVLRALFRPT